MEDRFERSNNYKTMQQIVTNKIRNGILDGTFTPDQWLNQAELAEQLKVSRIPTREALRTLEGEGLVTFYPHRGAVVSTMSSDEIEEVYEIRIMLEISAAQRALKLMNQEEFQKVRKLQAEMMKAKEINQWVRLNDLFHTAIYRPSNWTRLVSVIEMLRNLTTPYVRMYVRDQFDRDVANLEHEEIVVAMEAGDSVALKASLRRHLAHSCQGILAYLKRVQSKKDGTQEREGSLFRSNGALPGS
jgi:DNA-binding GntR family transcriptional regulator